MANVRIWIRGITVWPGQKGQLSAVKSCQMHKLHFLRAHVHSMFQLCGVKEMSQPNNSIKQSMSLLMVQAY